MLEPCSCRITLSDNVSSLDLFSPSLDPTGDLSSPSPSLEPTGELNESSVDHHEKQRTEPFMPLKLTD